MLKIHFFTIVLNGEPFIRHHIGVFERLKVPWHWHLIEGVAAHRHDTAWGAKRGGTIPLELKGSTLSTDGTREYLDELQRKHPDQVTVYRKPSGEPWDGKLEMINAPMSNLPDECLLWEVDSDELWTVEQIEKAHALFTAQPDRTAAWFICRFFVSPEFCTEKWNVFGNKVSTEWLRLWRFRKGDRWASHEPPRLVRPQRVGEALDVGRIQPFMHQETMDAGLIFQHFAYATEAQLQFKESYYGYRGAVAAWKKFIALGRPNVKLRNFLLWIWEAEIGKARTFRTAYRVLASPFSAASMAEPIRAKGIMPLAQKNQLGRWRFYASQPPDGSVLTLLALRADRIGDHVLSGWLIAALRKNYPYAKLVVACPEDVRELHDHLPDVDELFTFDRDLGHRSAKYRAEITRKLRNLRADLAINPQYTRDRLSGFLMQDCGAKCKVGFDAERRTLSEKRWRQFQNAFDRLVPTGGPQTSELQRYGMLIQALGFSETPEPPRFPVTTDDEAFADKFFKGQDARVKRWVVFFTGSAQKEKAFRGYGKALRSALGPDFGIIALGGSPDVTACAEELEGIGLPAVNLCGKATLRQAAALFRRCELAVGPDTGLAHLACASGCPQVVVMGGGDFGRFFPYSPLTSVLCLPLDCYDCQWNCRFAEAHCIRQISSDALAEVVRQTLASKSSKPRVFFQKSLQTQSDAAAPQPKWQLPEKSRLLQWETITI